jgi:NAD(P)H-hydrate epimerase
MPPRPLRLTRAQVREVDRLATERYHVPGIVLMENAARGAADVAWEMLGHETKSVVIVCGPGNNGGDGMAIARHLHNRGAQVELIFGDFDPEKYKGDARINWEIVRAMGLTHDSWESAQTRLKEQHIDLIVDALFGTGLSQPPRGTSVNLIEWMNRAGVPVLAVDLPSGLDCDTGVPWGTACVLATRTVTFVAEKLGFAHPGSRQYLGQVTIADIGCPREVIDDVLRQSK